GRNRQKRHDAVGAWAAQVFNRGDETQIDFMPMEELGAARGNVVSDVEPRMAFEAVDERTRVQVADRAEAQRTHRASGSNRPFRSTGSRPAARMLRRISSSGARRGPWVASSSADTPS